MDLGIQGLDERDSEPDLVSIRWTGPADLLIVVTIDPNIDVPVIDKSLHRFGGVTISYRFDTVQ